MLVFLISKISTHYKKIQLAILFEILIKKKLQGLEIVLINQKNIILEKIVCYIIFKEKILFVWVLSTKINHVFQNSKVIYNFFLQKI